MGGKVPSVEGAQYFNDKQRAVHFVYTGQMTMAEVAGIKGDVL
jgi:hypothetical protein